MIEIIKTATLLCMLLFAAVLSANTYVHCYVSNVVDGDTIYVIAKQSGLLFTKDKEYKVRLIGVNAPEITFGKNEPYGTEAYEYTKRMLLNKDVYLELDVDYYDNYDRVLAYVWLDVPKEATSTEITTKLFNYILVIEGYANVMTVPPNVKYQAYFLEAERNARAKNKGLWGLNVQQQQKVEQPTASQQQQQIVRVQIISIVYKGKNEQVFIKNTGNTEVNLRGWKLVSAKGGQTFVFPSIVLKPGQVLSVCSGPEASGTIIWTKQYIWNDNGDTAKLVDPNGNVVSTLSY